MSDIKITHNQFIGIYENVLSKDTCKNIIELFEDQKEIKTGQKNEEIILYCFLGVFVIYIMDF